MNLTLKRAPRTDTNSNSIFANSVYNCIDDLSGESCAPFFVTAPSICAFVGHRLKELIREVAVCAVDLHPIESGTVYGVAGCFRVRGNIIVDLGLGQCTRWLRLAGQRDRRCGDVR